MADDTVIGPLLQEAMTLVIDNSEKSLVAAARFGGRHEAPDIPVVIQLKNEVPNENESWLHYKERVMERLHPARSQLEEFGITVNEQIAANSLSAEVNPELIPMIRDIANIAFLELDPIVQLTNMDDALSNIDHTSLVNNHPMLDGSGVKVAVLDSGIDRSHPYLNVYDSVSTCGESDSIPGSHGTHCAGSIASRDSIFGGVAPNVDLLNIKVLRADGSGQHTFITSGVDEALDRDADIISMSLGFNHLPRSSWNGHGWSCSQGYCPLCTAVDNAVLLENTLAVVAAGNEHQKAEYLRSIGQGNMFDTELGCPGQARSAITVAALSNKPYTMAAFSSRGPSAYGDDKITIGAPGVNIMSTVPVLRASDGQPIHNPARADLFAVKSGTSMATPIVAGALALFVQNAIDKGILWTPASIKSMLLSNATFSLPFTVIESGKGALDLSHY